MFRREELKRKGLEGLGFRVRLAVGLELGDVSKGAIEKERNV